MRTRPTALVAVALMMSPSVLTAQALGFGARIGTLGVGGEVALGLSDRIVVRGGFGLLPLEPTVRMSDIEWSLKLGDRWYNAGVDLYLNGVVRLGAGFLFKPDDPRLTAALDESVTVGGLQFTPAELGTLTATADIEDRRPYALLGFGRHTAPGGGLFLDLGAVWFGDTTMRVESQGGSFADREELDRRLRQAETDLEADLGAYLKVWLILSIGIRMSVG